LEREGETGEMITNRSEVEEFEKELLRKEKVDFTKNLSIVNAMYNEAVALGVIPMKNPLDGLEVDIRVARVVNNVPEAP
jgi:hypothetical protein